MSRVTCLLGVLLAAGCATGTGTQGDTGVDPGVEPDAAPDAAHEPDASMDPDAASDPDLEPGDVGSEDLELDPSPDTAHEPDASMDPDAASEPDLEPEDVEPEDVGADDVPVLLPDLVPESITRDSYYYRVQYCNRGAATSTSTFLISITNTGTGASFESNPMYPFSVPAVGTCAWTGGFTCSLIGPGCTASLTVRATVDTRDTVAESNETNNDHSVTF